MSDRLGSGCNTCNAVDEAPEFGTVGAEECDAFVNRTFPFSPERFDFFILLKTFFFEEIISFWDILSGSQKENLLRAMGQWAISQRTLSVTEPWMEERRWMGVQVGQILTFLYGGNIEELIITAMHC